MKEVLRPVYEANDGSVFLTSAECEGYENLNYHHRLVGLTLAQVDDALNRNDLALAEAFEKAGTRIATARRDAGELKRGRRSHVEKSASSETAPAKAADADDATANETSEHAGHQPKDVVHAPLTVAPTLVAAPTEEDPFATENIAAE